MKIIEWLIGVYTEHERRKDEEYERQMDAALKLQFTCEWFGCDEKRGREIMKTEESKK